MCFFRLSLSDLSIIKLVTLLLLIFTGTKFRENGTGKFRGTESDGKYLLQKLNSGQLMNYKVKILGKFFYSPRSKDVAGLESV